VKAMTEAAIRELDKQNKFNRKAVRFAVQRVGTENAVDFLKSVRLGIKMQQHLKLNPENS